MAATPMLDDLELAQVQEIESGQRQALAEHGVPALEGDFLQRLGRNGTRLDLRGVLTGSDVRDSLEALRKKFRKAEPVSFVADIATATSVEKVLIEEMRVRELAGKPEVFEYGFSLREFTPAPVPRHRRRARAPRRSCHLACNAAGRRSKTTGIHAAHRQSWRRALSEPRARRQILRLPEPRLWQMGDLR